MDMPSPAAERWHAFCESRGLQKGRAAEAAFMLFEALAPAIRDMVLAGKHDTIAALLARIDWDVLLESEVKKQQPTGKPGRAGGTNG